MADTHFLIEKKADGTQTITSVSPLGQEDVTRELARLIGGAEITAATLTAAAEMKALADGMKGRNLCNVTLP
jgi:DNA repair protein RecN (Recombination protein N)